MQKEEIMNHFMAELRRGNLILTVLSQLDKPEYGYSLIHKMQENQIEVDSNTLYPLMRRLETQGLLMSKVQIIQEKPRKYYQRTPLGDEVYQELLDQWRKLNQNIEKLIGGKKDE